ncbi:hypothetical protein [Plantactinospora sp. GCM10030261]|uniref:hypothetical protein n=1 Tax=Plantactinospora sp. GCM10030261 TaxID=3273420 RepID=UPI00361F6AB3
MMWRHLPPVGRTIAVATVDAVGAARARDVDGYVTATDRLAAVDPRLVGPVLGTVTRMLLEETHPNGLTGEDLREIQRRAARSAEVWLPDTDGHAIGVLLTGALGVQPDEAGPVEATAVARHAPLLLADLVTASGLPLADFLDAAFAETARTETMELP